MGGADAALLAAAGADTELLAATAKYMDADADIQEISRSEHDSDEPMNTLIEKSNSALDRVTELCATTPAGLTAKTRAVMGGEEASTAA